MIQLKLIAALLVALSAIVVGAVTDNGLWKISYPLQQAMAGMPSRDQAYPEKAYSFAENYLNGFGRQFDARAVNELTSAWKRVVYQPNQCDWESLKHIATIAKIAPQNSSPMRTLTEATQKYARKCVTPGLIKIAIDATLGRASIKRDGVTSEFKLIDDIISDYLSRYPQDRKFLHISQYGSGRVIETKFCDHRTLNNNENCATYMERRLYAPCSKLQGALTDVVEQISSASNFLGRSYDNLIASLDLGTQNVVSRFNFCHVIPSWRGLNYKKVTPSSGPQNNQNVTPYSKPLNNKSWFLRCFS